MIALISLTFLILSIMVVYMCSMGVPILYALSIFIFPIIIFSQYYILTYLSSKNDKRIRVSQLIVDSVRSNDNGKSISDIFDSLEDNLKKYNIKLNVNFKGYITDN